MGIASGVVGAGGAIAPRQPTRRMGAIENHLELTALANRRSDIVNQIKTNRRPSLIEKLNSQARDDLTEIKRIEPNESNAKKILTRMNELYSPENIIGSTQDGDNFPTVYYRSGQLTGRITLDYHKFSNLGKDLPRRNVFFKNTYRRGKWRLHENYYFGNTTLSHTSRGPFTPITKISASSFEDLVHSTEDAFRIKGREIVQALKSAYSVSDID